jgi:hypothetical protein
MRLAALLQLLILASVASAQNGPRLDSIPELKSVTVPITLDHNRVVINVDLPLPDGSSTRVHAWVDNGNPELYLSRRLATLLGLKVACGERECSAPPPREIAIGSMKISLAALHEAKIPLNPAAAAAVMAPGMSAEINVPASVLRNYDVLIDFPGRELTIAQIRSFKFKGVKTKVIVNARNGLIQVPSQIERKKYNLALDLGSSISFLSQELFDKFAAAHPDWPHMTGAVGPANLWGSDDEPNWKLMRLDRLQYGPLYLTSVPFARFNSESAPIFGEHRPLPATGLLGADALLNYRVGLDYAHSTVYFDIGRLFNFPEFDVVGLILRPEDDGRFTILGIADYESKPSVPEGEDGVHPGDHLVEVNGIAVSGLTLGQVWSLLGGTPGMERRLTLERGGKQFAVTAKVQHFLGEAELNNAPKEKSGRN